MHLEHAAMVGQVCLVKGDAKKQVQGGGAPD